MVLSSPNRAVDLSHPHQKNINSGFITRRVLVPIKTLLIVYIRCEKNLKKTLDKPLFLIFQQYNSDHNYKEEAILGDKSITARKY